MLSLEEFSNEMAEQLNAFKQHCDDNDENNPEIINTWWARFQYFVNLSITHNTYG